MCGLFFDLVGLMGVCVCVCVCVCLLFVVVAFVFCGEVDISSMLPIFLLAEMQGESIVFLRYYYSSNS
jgi:hypothetical protein